jgi:hypothetical protein
MTGGLQLFQRGEPGKDSSNLLNKFRAQAFTVAELEMLERGLVTKECLRKESSQVQLTLVFQIPLILRDCRLVRVASPPFNACHAEFVMPSLSSKFSNQTCLIEPEWSLIACPTLLEASIPNTVSEMKQCPSGIKCSVTSTT